MNIQKPFELMILKELNIECRKIKLKGYYKMRKNIIITK